MSNNKWLKDLLAHNPGMTRRWVAEHLHVNLSTVDRWLVPKTRQRKHNTTYRAMPDSAVALMQYVMDDPEVNTRFE